ncbi:unknown [Bacteroides sp. CAG:754]|nr:unknown [Bacteroides sp. CAG:754]
MEKCSIFKIIGKINSLGTELPEQKHIFKLHIYTDN